MDGPVIAIFCLCRIVNHGGLQNPSDPVGLLEPVASN